jgi:hypothetical protein
MGVKKPPMAVCLKGAFYYGTDSHDATPPLKVYTLNKEDVKSKNDFDLEATPR